MHSWSDSFNNIVYTAHVILTTALNISGLEINPFDAFRTFPHEFRISYNFNNPRANYSNNNLHDQSKESIRTSAILCILRSQLLGEGDDHAGGNQVKFQLEEKASIGEKSIKN